MFWSGPCFIEGTNLEIDKRQGNFVRASNVASIDEFTTLSDGFNIYIDDPIQDDKMKDVHPGLETQFILNRI